ncbi:MAG TPA: CPBP family glutamic-type intramembrane protease [Elusimicrobiota bacterium]|nr:CPBP family glutamic-type intramembrane protease [Elusimicrobiota bacterium]
MRRHAFLAILLAAAPRAQAALPRVTLEAAPVTASAGSAVAAVLAPSLSPAVSPSALTAAAFTPLAFAAPSAPSFAPAMAAAPALAASPAALAPDAPAPAPVEPAAEPRRWSFGRWSLPKEDASAWSFRDSWIFSAKLWDGAERARSLGAGEMGSVFVHPSRPDAVVKVARRGYAEAAGQYMSDDETELSFEDYDLARLAALGAAPKPLSRVTVSGRPASVRERIYGETVRQLARRGAFKPRERDLVQDLLKRIADGGFAARDLNLGNIMIGRRGEDSEERAYLVDTLGLRIDPSLDGAARLADMLAEPVPWIAFKGLGLARPLGRMLDAKVNRFIDPVRVERTTIPWSKPKRYAALAGILGVLAVAPPLVHAVLPAPFTPGVFNFGLGILPSAKALVAAGAAIGVAGYPLRILAYRLSPWTMRRAPSQQPALFRQHPILAVPNLFFVAGCEELVFRALVFGMGAGFLLAFAPALPVFAAVSLAAALGFALIHGYGPVWTRVVGAMIYAGAFLVSGSLLLPIVAHFSFNMLLYVRGRYFKRV